MVFPLEIPKRGSRCAANQELLEGGMEYYSLLIPEEAGFSRLDYCPSCWQEISSAEGKIHWKSRVSLKADKPDLKHLSRDDKVFYLLREALKSDHSDALAESFVLSLYLARRRLIALRKEFAENGSDFLLYEVMATEEMLLVPKIKLSEIQTAEIQGQLAKKLKS